MIRLARGSGVRAVSRAKSGGNCLRRADGITASSGRVITPSSTHTNLVGNVGLAGGSAFNMPITAAHFFSLAKAARPARMALSKEAPLSAVAAGQAAPKGSLISRLPVIGKWVESPQVKEALAKFRVGMMRDRRPFEILGVQTVTTGTNICGHIGFTIVTMAFLQTDVLALRMYAVSSIVFGALFQYYRANPLWISLQWNALLMVINVGMIGSLLKERSDAEKLKDDPEQSQIFNEVFEPVDLTPVDFLRLMNLAERYEIGEGEHLFDEGKVQEEVFLIAEGNVEVNSEGVAVSQLESKQFVGSMAFIRYIHAPPPAVRRNTAAPPSARLSQQKSRRLSSKLSSRLSYNSNRAQDAAGRPTGDMDDDEDDDEIDSSYIPGGGGVFKEAKEAAQSLRRQDSFIGDIAKALVPEDKWEDEEDMERSATTVITTSDVVLYAWNMHELREFMKARPTASAAVQKAISVDLTRKVDQSRGQKERYRLLLAEALEGGVVTPIEKKKLMRYRQTHRISYDDHARLLRRYNWNESDFDAGFQKGINPRQGSKNFVTYEVLVERELAKGKVDEEGRRFLRQFRAQAGIDAHEHLLALEKQGWTSDEYEIGHKVQSDDSEEASQGESDSGSGSLARRDTAGS